MLRLSQTTEKLTSRYGWARASSTFIRLDGEKLVVSGGTVGCHSRQTSLHEVNRRRRRIGHEFRKVSLPEDLLLQLRFSGTEWAIKRES